MVGYRHLPDKQLNIYAFETSAGFNVHANMFLFPGSLYISIASLEQDNLPDSGSKYRFILRNKLGFSTAMMEAYNTRMHNMLHYIWMN